MFTNKWAGKLSRKDLIMGIALKAVIVRRALRSGMRLVAGHTHYWSYTKGQAFSDSEWSRITSEAKRIIGLAMYEDIEVAGPDGTGKPDITPSVIELNGKGDETAEVFRLEKDGGLKQPRPWAIKEDYISDFCKTYGRPYDAVVVSILAVAQETAPDKIKVSSDGGPGAIKMMF